MRRIIFMAIVLAVTVAGCNRFPDLSVQVTANLAPAGDNCELTEDQTLAVPRGRVDLLFTPQLGQTAYGYVMNPQITSYLVDNSLDIQAVSQNFQVDSFDVTIKLPDNSIPVLSGGLPNPYRVPASSPVIEPSVEEGGFSTSFAFVEAIPFSYRDAVFDLVNTTSFTSIVLDLRANGETSGGFAQQSPPFSWPVEVCLGCLAARCEPPARVGDGVGCYPGQDSDRYCTEVVNPEDEGT